MRTPHTSAPKGIRVRIVLKDGRKFITKFLSKENGMVRTEAGEFHQGKIKVFAIYKAMAHER